MSRLIWRTARGTHRCAVSSTKRRQRRTRQADLGSVRRCSSRARPLVITAGVRRRSGRAAARQPPALGRAAPRHSADRVDEHHLAHLASIASPPAYARAIRPTAVRKAPIQPRLRPPADEAGAAASRSALKGLHRPRKPHTMAGSAASATSPRCISRPSYAICHGEPLEVRRSGRPFMSTAPRARLARHHVRASGHEGNITHVAGDHVHRRTAGIAGPAAAPRDRVVLDDVVDAWRISKGAISRPGAASVDPAAAAADVEEHCAAQTHRLQPSESVSCVIEMRGTRRGACGACRCDANTSAIPRRTREQVPATFDQVRAACAPKNSCTRRSTAVRTSSARLSRSTPWNR